MADNLKKRGWSLGYASMADAHRDDGKRFFVRADEKLSAFVELESTIRACGELV